MKKQTLTHNEDVTKAYDRKEIIPTLVDAIKTLISCAENIREATETIIYSCDDITNTKFKSLKDTIA